MPKTVFTAEELSTFIRKSILICVVVTILNGVAIFITTCVFKEENRKLQTQVGDNGKAILTLNTTVANDVAADQAWRDQLGKANPKIVTPKIIQPTPVPLPKTSGATPKLETPPPAIIVVPSPTPVIKKEIVVKRVLQKPKPTATPVKFFQWGPKSRINR